MFQISINRRHMLEKRKGPGQKPQAITVKFTRYKDRYHVFRNKKLLKGSCISVTESLTLKRIENSRKREKTWFCKCLDTRWGRCLREMIIRLKIA